MRFEGCSGHCVAGYTGTVILSHYKAQAGCGEVLLVAGARLGSVSLVALETLGLFLRFSGQIDLCPWFTYLLLPDTKV